MKKRILTALLALCLLGGVTAAFALEAGDARAVIGADLTPAQRETVYESFGIKRGSVRELFVSNDEERQYLDGFVDSEKIGTRSISCVYIEILPEGSGLDIRTEENITWCTREMFGNALATAGIKDAKVIVASPWAVSGTAALTGIFKAYEDISGETLDEAAKLLGTQELVITAELADEIGKYDAVTIVNELKALLGETETMSDDELREEIRRLAKQYDVGISDEQIEKLISLCRSFEKLSVEELKEKVERAQDTIKRFSKAKEKAADFAEKASGFVEKVKNVFHAVVDFFSGLVKKFS